MSKIQPLIRYIMGDMIPLNQSSSLFQDSPLNRTPRENFYISSWEGPNEISQDVPDRERIVIYVVKFLDSDDEIGTRGIPYNFTMLNSPERSHLGKTLISPNWKNQFWSNLWCWKEDIWGSHSMKFQR